MPTLFAAEGRPPYVVFEERAIENREETLRVGNPQYRSEDWAVIRQVGAKDSFEKPALEWLEGLRFNPAMRAEWIAGFRAQFKEYKQGFEATPDGTAVKMCPIFTKSQVETLLGAGLRTVEDLAHAPEPALMRVGLGARALQESARNYLSTASDVGRAAQKIGTLEIEIAGLKTQMSEQMRKFQELQGDMRARGPTNPGTTNIGSDDFLGAAA